MRISIAIALLAGVLSLTALGASAAPPVIVVLTSDGTTSLPAPGQPKARVVLSISQPRVRRDGYLASVVRFREVDAPPRLSFVRLDFGPYHAYISCKDRPCPAAMGWVYSPKKLAALRRFGAYVEAFIHAPTGHIWSVAGGRIERDRFELPRARPAAADPRRATLRARLSIEAAGLRPTSGREPPAGIFSAEVWPYAHGSVSLTFRLTTSRLTGPVTSAHIHTGTPGLQGPVLVTLCSHGRCNISSKTFRGIPPSIIEAMRIFGAYVDVHTRRHPRGELRGQIVIR